MTNDDTLLAGFLDRSLSEEQLLELEARKAASPEFAQQFSNMLAVESMLASAAPKSHIPANFLHAVENTVAATVVAGGSAAGAWGFMNGLSSAWVWLGGSALVLVTAGTLYYSNLPSSTPAPEPAAQTPAVQSVPSPTPVAQPVQSNPTVSTTEPSVSHSTSQPQAPTQPDASGDRLDNLKSQDGPDVFADLVVEYKQAVASGDIIAAATKARVLARGYAERKNFSSSDDYFTKAVEHARKAKLVEIEISALGEHGKTFLTRGNQSQARLLFEQAIERGSQTGMSVSVWTEALKDLR